MTSTREKLQFIRQLMRTHNIDVYIVPGTDAHNSEYVPDAWQYRKWISNFTGSAGDVIITVNNAYLMTDGRYFTQAENELDSSCYSLIRQTGLVSELENWLLHNVQNQRVAIDPKLIAISKAKNFKLALAKVGASFHFISENLVENSKEHFDSSNQLPNNPVFSLATKYSGQDSNQKLAMVREQLQDNKADYLVLNVLDEIAWLFNLRGSDVEFNPLAIAYAIIGRDSAKLFLLSTKISNELNQLLAGLGVSLLPYSEFSKHLRNIDGSVWLDDKTMNFWVSEILLDQSRTNDDQPLTMLHYQTSPIVTAKACKNSIEQNGMINAHIRDAVAVIDFLSWLKSNWQEQVDEITAATRLRQFREQQDNIIGDSFATISGFGSNGAIIHYRASATTSKIIDDSNLYLVDSGAQYLDGTTDITRTIHLGNPNNQQKRHYTLVLKGHLALARAKFPVGTHGEHLDALARQHLWQHSLDYRHGTGHGVGCFLCVHEGPQRISKGISPTPLLPGMIVSNEPGFYLQGQYGIRIENLCLITEYDTKSEYGPFYQLQNLTLVPYCKKLIELSMLDSIEIAQIREYYSTIRQQLSPLLNSSSLEWLNQELDFTNGIY